MCQFSAHFLRLVNVGHVGCVLMKGLELRVTLLGKPIAHLSWPLAKHTGDYFSLVEGHNKGRVPLLWYRENFA